MIFCDFQFLSSFFHFFFSTSQCVLVWRLHLMQPDLQFNVSVIVSSLFAISVFSICHKSLTFYSQSSANPFQTSSFANFVNQHWLMLLNHRIDVKQPKHVWQLFFLLFSILLLTHSFNRIFHIFDFFLVFFYYFGGFIKWNLFSLWTNFL